MTARVLIVDDEAVARRRVRRYLAADPTMSIVGECADGAAAVKQIETLSGVWTLGMYLILGAVPLAWRAWSLSGRA